MSMMVLSNVRRVRVEYSCTQRKSCRITLPKNTFLPGQEFHCGTGKDRQEFGTQRNGKFHVRNNYVEDINNTITVSCPRIFTG